MKNIKFNSNILLGFCLTVFSTFSVIQNIKGHNLNTKVVQTIDAIQSFNDLLPDCDSTDAPFINGLNGDAKIIVPFYVYPVADTEGNRNNPNESWKITAWQNLQTYAQTLGSRLVVIVDPSGPGPGSSVNSDYTREINKLRANGAKVLGYIEIGFGNRNQAEIDGDLADWFSWYKIDGIFYDEAHIAEVWKYTGLYSSLYRLVQQEASKHETLSQEKMVVFNPGTIPSGGWNMHHGLICTYENSEGSFAGLQNNLANLTPDQKRRSVILIHGLPKSGWEDRYNWLTSNGFNNFYFTSKVFNQHPWNFDSPYFSDMVDKIK